VSKSYRVMVMCGWWERPYTFVVEGDTAVAEDGPKIPYDTETLRANAREKGSYWRWLPAMNDPPRSGEKGQ
jgi:hypothetical protein